MSGYTCKKNQETHFSASNAEETATTITYQVPTVSNAGQYIRQVKNIIKNSIIQMAVQSATTLYSLVNPEMLLESSYDASHKPVPVLQ